MSNAPTAVQRKSVFQAHSMMELEKAMNTKIPLGNILRQYSADLGNFSNRQQGYANYRTIRCALHFHYIPP